MDDVDAFFSCPNKNIAGLALLGLLQGVLPDLSPERAVQLQLGDDLPQDEELAVMYLLATSLKFIWDTRVSKKQVVLHQMRSELEARITILRKSKYRDAAMKMTELLET